MPALDEMVRVLVDHLETANRRPGEPRQYEDDPHASKLFTVKPGYFAARLSPGGVELSRFASSSAATVPLAAAVGALIGVALVAKPIVVLGLVALVIALIGVAVAVARPAIAYGGLIAAMALIPTYAAPKIGPLLFDPAAAGCWLVAIALMFRNALTEGVLYRPNYVDVAVWSFVVLMTVSLSFSGRAELTDLVHDMFLWVGPYLAARLLMPKIESPVKVTALAFAAVAVILAPIAVSEALGGSNPFFNLDFNSGEFAIWASQINRFGAIRAVTSFGHPIAYSMFLAASALLSIAMGIATSAAKPRLAWYAAAAVAIGTMALALSRTGWLMLAIGIVALAAVSVRGPIRKRLFTLFALVIGVVLVTSVVLPQELQVLPGVGHSQESNYATSGLYREALLHRALQPGVLGLWGNAHNMVTPAVNFGTATDNTYIILADMWGLIPTFALFAVGISLLVALAASYGLPGEPIAILPIIGFTCMVAIFFVAFITQQQVMIWFLVGAGGAAAELIASRRRQRRQDQRRSRVRDWR
jgi:hypothetical protein